MTTVRRPACAAADSIPARPAVKFRLTAARPASAAARFTSEPPTLVGSRMPTAAWPSQRGRRARAIASAPARALKYETRGVWKSAKASRDGCRRARRTNS